MIFRKRLMTAGLPLAVLFASQSGHAQAISPD